MLKKNFLIFFLIFGFNCQAEYKQSFMMTNDGEVSAYVKLSKNRHYLKFECNNIFNNFTLYFEDRDINKLTNHTYTVRSSFDKKNFITERWKKVYKNRKYILSKSYNNYEFIKKIIQEEEVLIDMPEINKIYLIKLPDSLNFKNKIHEITKHCNL